MNPDEKREEMKNSNILFCLILFVVQSLLSCSISKIIEKSRMNKNYYNTSYDRYRDIHYFSETYMVDTIMIDSPTIVRHKNALFVFPSMALTKPSLLKKKRFYSRPDVFVMPENSIMWCTRDICRQKKSEYLCIDNEWYSRNCKNMVENVPRKLCDSTFFVLRMGNVQYYNVSNICIDCAGYHLIKNKGYSKAFYPFVYPLKIDTVGRYDDLKNKYGPKILISNGDTILFY